MRLSRAWLLLAVAVLLLARPLWAESREVREPVFAGSWYPGTGQALEAMLDDFLGRAGTRPVPGRLVALAAPHAGLPYSGPIAAWAYKALKGQGFETVVLIGPSHRAAFNGVSIYDHGAYKTPLGLTAIDIELAAALKAQDPDLRYVPKAHAREHCLEIQLPFLQRRLDRFKIVPLVMGSQDYPTCQRLAKALAACGRGRSMLLVASTDLSHHHSSALARALDDVVMADVRAFDPEALHRDLSLGRCEACGGGPLVATMIAARLLGADRGAVLAYADTSAVTMDKSSVVGYMSAAFWDSGQAEAGQNATPTSGLKPEDRSALLAMARASVKAAIEGRDYLPPDPPAALSAPSGAFVTLKKNGVLRGCIGRLSADAPLYLAVVRMARAAAFEDPRFPPLDPAEFEDLSFEISVISPFKRIKDIAEVRVGEHGLLMRRGFRSGLLLPQVPGEWGWDRDEFLEHTCLKAGLPGDCWRDPSTEIYVFTAEVF